MGAYELQVWPLVTKRVSDHRCGRVMRGVWSLVSWSKAHCCCGILEEHCIYISQVYTTVLHLPIRRVMNVTFLGGESIYAVALDNILRRARGT